jgi:hypothetical protein
MRRPFAAFTAACASVALSGAVAYCCSAFQLGKLRRRRLVLLGIVDGGGSYFLQAVVERILLGRRGGRLQDIVEQPRAGGALNARNIDAISRQRRDEHVLAGVAVLIGTGDIARDHGGLHTGRHQRRASRVECDRECHACPRIRDAPMPLSASD